MNQEVGLHCNNDWTTPPCGFDCCAIDLGVCVFTQSGSIPALRGCHTIERFCDAGEGQPSARNGRSLEPLAMSACGSQSGRSDDALRRRHPHHISRSSAAISTPERSVGALVIPPSPGRTLPGTPRSKCPRISCGRKRLRGAAAMVKGPAPDRPADGLQRG